MVSDSEQHVRKRRRTEPAQPNKANRALYRTPSPVTGFYVPPERRSPVRTWFPAAATLADILAADADALDRSLPRRRDSSLPLNATLSPSPDIERALIPVNLEKTPSQAEPPSDAEVLEMPVNIPKHSRPQRTKVVKTKRRIAGDKPTRYSQTGPERPGEFDTCLQAVMSAPHVDRRDPRRAQVFEQMMAVQSFKEEPNAPPITVTPHPEEACPEFNFVFTSRVIYRPGLKSTQSLGCGCVSECKAGDMGCACFLRQSEENARHGYAPSFAYAEKGRLQFKPDQNMAIWECNDMCGCPPSCINRQVGRGRQVPIELYRTEFCGWGAKLGPIKRSNPSKRGKVKAGTFIGVYSGELIDTSEAHRRDMLYNSINLSYLFDLDFASIGKNENLKGFDEDGIALISTTYRTVDGKQQETETRRSLLCPPMTASLKTPGHKKKDEDEINNYNSFFSVDAFHYGGVCRFFNHNCQPNCMLRCCYTNEGDPTKPLLAIFSVRTIYSGEAITISYTGDLGLDEEDIEEALLNMPASVAATKSKGRKKKKGKKAGKKAQPDVRTCWCDAPRCTGQMFVQELLDTSGDEE